MRKIVDERYHYCGPWPRAERGICWVRIFAEVGKIPIIVLAELPTNTATSVTSMAEYLVPQVIRHYCPERFEEEVPALIVEHYPAESTARGTRSRQSTWDQLTFETWTPRIARLSGARRLMLGAPEWAPLSTEEVIALIGGEEVAAAPPD